jgi:hypothetical protein
MPGRRSGRDRRGSSGGNRLRLLGSELTLELRPRWWYRLLDDDEGLLAIALGDGTEIFPVSGKFWKWNPADWSSEPNFEKNGRAIGLQPHGKSASYFCAATKRERAEILQVLHTAGFNVSSDERQYVE